MEPPRTPTGDDVNKYLDWLGRTLDPSGWAQLDEVKRLRDENRAMIPVVIAAQIWARDEGGGVEIDGEWYAVETLCEALAEAVETYNAHQEEGT
jgi:hypothetical protein